LCNGNLRTGKDENKNFVAGFKLLYGSISIDDIVRCNSLYDTHTHHTNIYTNVYAYSYTDTNAYTYAHTNPNTYSHSYAYPYSYTGAQSFPWGGYRILVRRIFQRHTLTRN
jgi:hypothetical protein